MSPPPPPGGGSFRSSMQPRGAAGRAGTDRPRDPRHAVRRLLPYLHPHRFALLIILALVLLYTVLGLVGPYLMGVAIDGYITNHDIRGLGIICSWMLASYLLYNLFQAAAAWMMTDIAQRALKQLRRDLFGHIQELPVRFFDTHGAGELMSRLTNDIDVINQAVSMNVIALFGSVLSLVGIIIAMFVLDYWLALAALIVVPIMIWFTRFIARYTRKGYRQLQGDLGQLNATCEEAISGQRVVKAFRRNDSAIATFREHNDAVYRAGIYANTYALLLMPLTSVLGNLFVIVIAALGGYLALIGLVTVGTIATFISYGRDFINPLRQVANMYTSIQSALAGAERVFEILDTPTEIDDPTTAPAPFRGQVRFDHVHFAYSPETPIIHDMTLHAAAGDTIALVGPTGAGKTTIINLLTRFYEIDSGTITIDGVDIRQLPKAHLRRQLGLVLQDTYLFSGTVIENIRYGRLDATDDACIEAAQLADADHFIRQLPQGYQTPLSERGNNLSQGQRQLLAIARVILAAPNILILDEATSSVDTRTEARIQGALLRLMANRTSFVIAHRLSTIREARQVLVIDHGAIVESGTHHQLLERQGRYYDLYMSQYKGQAT